LLYKRIAKLGKVTTSEKKLADFFEHKYPLIALESVTSISEKVGVGKATVVRFISRLGYKGFADFQKQVRKELIHQYESPFTRYTDGEQRVGHPIPDYLANYIAHAKKTFNEIQRRISQSELLKAAQIMARCKGTLYVAGQGASHSLAHLFWVKALYLRDRIVLIQNLTSALPHQLAGVSREDVLFGISSQRYGCNTFQVAQWFYQREAAIIMLTDRELTPFSDLTTMQFVAPSDGISMLDSNCARVAVIESLIVAMEKDLSGEIKRRAEICESLFSSFSMFVPQQSFRTASGVANLKEKVAMLDKKRHFQNHR